MDFFKSCIMTSFLLFPPDKICFNITYTESVLINLKTDYSAIAVGNEVGKSLLCNKHQLFNVKLDYDDCNYYY